MLNLPATLKLYYTDDDISGSLAILLGLAFQGSDGIWYSIPERSIDTVNTTISISTEALFTVSSPTKASETGALEPADGGLDWGTFTDMYILPAITELRVNESKAFQVMVVIYPQGSSGGGNEDELPALPRSREVSSRTVRSWATNGVTNGNSQYGTIVPDGAHCTYTAPGTKPSGSKNPVQLSADLANLVYRNPVTGSDMTNLTLNTPVKIIDDNYSFQLDIDFRFESYPAALFMWTLTDNSKVDIEVVNGLVTVIIIHLFEIPNNQTNETNLSYLCN